MSSNISIPVEGILSIAGKMSINSKTNFRGYVISTTSERIGTSGDLRRTDIRVYKDDEDVTSEFLQPGNSILFSSEDLFSIMNQIAAQN